MSTSRSRAAAGSMRMSAASTSLWYTGHSPFPGLSRDGDIGSRVVQPPAPERNAVRVRRRCMALRIVQPVLRDAHGGIGVPASAPGPPATWIRKGPPAPAAEVGSTPNLQARGSGSPREKHIRQHGHVRNEVCSLSLNSWSGPRACLTASDRYTLNSRGAHRPPPGLPGVL